MDLAVEMKNITMRFPNVVANDNVNLSIIKGEIHALVGENGAGKSTLMNILYGLYKPTEGEIFIHGQQVHFKSAIDAIKMGIGMVHQHFMLIPRFTVAENIVLGSEPRSRLRFDRKSAAVQVGELSREYRFTLDPHAKTRSISLGAQQRVEIAKALYRKAEILILDEPTAVLTPQEIDDLGVMLKDLRNHGKTIIIITHKLKEVMTFSDRITVLRSGKAVKTLDTKQTDYNEITRLMVGRDVNLERSNKETHIGDPVLTFENVSYHDGKRLKLKNISFQMYSGEILGIAGIDNSGQKELTELAAGIIRPTQGRVLIDGKEVSKIDARKAKKHGVGFISQDRQQHGLALDMSIAENLILGYQYDKQYIKQKLFLDTQHINQNAENGIAHYDIRPTDAQLAVRNLSGGNQQKVVVARESSYATKMIIADQPSRGVDIGAIELIYKVFEKACNKEMGVLLSSLELDEVMALSDRIMVMFNGEIVGIVDGISATRNQIGLMMTGATEKKHE